MPDEYGAVPLLAGMDLDGYGPVPVLGLPDPLGERAPEEPVGPEDGADPDGIG